MHEGYRIIQHSIGLTLADLTPALMQHHHNGLIAKKRKTKKRKKMSYIKIKPVCAH